MPFLKQLNALKRYFLLPKLQKEVFGHGQTLGKSGKLQTVYWSLVSMVSAALISVQPVMADTIWDRFSTIMKDVYGEIVAISTIVAVTVAAIALVVRMVSRNQRAVEKLPVGLSEL